MSKQRKSYIQNDAKLSQRIAEEAQLLAEERWIIDALKKIKAQRNGLQIERLHLESMRNQIVSSQNKTQYESKSADKNIKLKETVTQEISAPECNTNSSNVITFPDMDYNDCNTEELNLSITNSIFNNEQYTTECDEEEDEDDMENCLIDMDILMSGK